MNGPQGMTKERIAEAENELGHILARSETVDSIRAAEIGLTLIGEFKKLELSIQCLRAMREPGV
ncbi:MAG: hypothetical protein LLG06_16395 [Desulfobacteraceae bacterium]|nr:hypothetical protein [Desulfobacteraceae bacterium]